MAITVDDARWIAHLARLELTADELIAIAGQLSQIMDSFQQIAALDTTGVEPLAHPLSLENVFRADNPTPSLAPDAALANAPKRNGNFYAVPAVFE